jgi:thiol-disulfide isomerase/thioredoxin
VRRRLLATSLAALALVAADAAEPIALRGLDGQAVEVAREPGEAALVIHFWASWCPECVTELPALERAAQACSGARVRVLAVNVGESAGEARRFAEQHGIGLRVLLDERGRAWRRAGLRGLPANLVWTAQGVRSSEGPGSAERWRAELAALGCQAS